ncbi:MAG TPA: divergent PAP2 family protein [bacterium]|nr:divergent PAP2 family protein [bacterium]
MKFIFITIPITAIVLSQFIFKPIISIIRGRFSVKDMFSYGGMPSSHSALVSSLSTTIGIIRGFDSPEFAISLFFALIVIIDAVGLRGFMSKQGIAINKLIKDLPDELEYKYEVMNERIAHTISQAIIGVLVGILIPVVILFYLI